MLQAVRLSSPCELIFKTLSAPLEWSPEVPAASCDVTPPIAECREDDERRTIAWQEDVVRQHLRPA
jgi:hypothetical protein